MEDTSPGMPLSCIRWKRFQGTLPTGWVFSPLRRITWAVIKDKGLLTETEIKRVSDFPGTVPGALQTGWRMPSWWKWWGERHGKKSFSLFLLEEGDVFFGQGLVYCSVLLFLRIESYCSLFFLNLHVHNHI